MKTGLVLEGGGCRGVFTSGVLDLFQERGLTFDYCVGVSAGAGNAMNFKSCQPGRALALTTGEDIPAYYGLSQARRSGKLLDLDLMYGRLSMEGPSPFDFGRYYENPMECEYTLTNCETGHPAYLGETVYRRRLIDIVKASCSMPGLCAPVEIDGAHYLDGGVADPMPVFRALAKGCDRVVLVTTKPASNLHPTDYTRLRPLMARLYKRRYPAFYAALMTRIPRYFAQLEEILELEREGQVFLIRPESCEIRSLEKDREKMRAYYRHGRETAEARWEALEGFLKQHPGAKPAIRKKI